MSKKVSILSLVVISITSLIIYTQLTLFVIPPMGAIPDGGTAVIFRLNKTHFIDSPDAMCDRIQGGVSLLCRGVMIGAVLENSRILVRLPYSGTLYRMSTGGKTFAG